eukprot:TRINITY_DN42490_c0_g1_i1.p1 TRINITY_DN42490_c0_g1~~TRINITY_DN42490_c0_g1_i1.p1  ORF type:complete len:396 (+),score=61.64 TRINITY_DN42490_c0_g1_i1:64-1251(+)
MDLRVGTRFRIGKKLGFGSFGEIFSGTNATTGEEIAVKLEPIKTRHPQLLYEYRMYRILSGGVGVPQARWFGTEGDYNVMVMDLLGKSLEDLFCICKRRFRLKTVLMLSDQMIARVEYLHSKNFIHRDIKPDNFLIGREARAKTVFMIDFGLAKKFRDPRTHQHLPYRENKSLIGTARYASVNAHLGIEQSRRDDLEALGYVFVYFLKGSLPWQGLKAVTKKQKYERIAEKKISYPMEHLCRGLPSEFVTYLSYARALRFDDKPDYSYLRRLFRDLFVREGYHYDKVFDWTGMNTEAEDMSQKNNAAAAPAAEARRGEDDAPEPAERPTEDRQRANPSREGIATGRATRQSVTHTPTSRTNQQPSARTGASARQVPGMRSSGALLSSRRQTGSYY